MLGLDGRFVTYFLIDFFEGVADVELVADTDGNGAPELAALRAAEVVDRDTAYSMC